MKGTVTKILGKACWVKADPPDENEYECYLRGRLFEDPNVQFAIGDRVELDPLEQFHPTGTRLSGGIDERLTGVIHEILPRRTALTRPARHRGGTSQLVAANVDQLVVVSALKNPSYKTGLIDRYLIVAHRCGIAPALCLNKIDLGDAREIDEAREAFRPYEKLEIAVVFTSAVTGEGIESLRELLRHRRSVLVGHSGVGKSKLAGRIQPGLMLPSREVGKRGKGRHTTTVAILFPLDFGGELVDTPGIRQLGIEDVDRSELARHFVEFMPYLDRCRFPSCSHIPEPDCAVKEAVERGEISRARYQSYEHLYHELKDSSMRT